MLVDKSHDQGKQLKIKLGSKQAAELHFPLAGERNRIIIRLRPGKCSEKWCLALDLDTVEVLDISLSPLWRRKRMCIVF